MDEKSRRACRLQFPVRAVEGMEVRDWEVSFDGWISVLGADRVLRSVEFH